MVNKKRTIKKMLFLAIMSLCAQAVFSLDIIVMKNGDEVEAIIKEIGINEVKYAKSSNPNGPVYTVLKSDIFQIKYENGTKEMFPEAGKNTAAAHENFTGGQRVGTWALNSVLPGVGSFAIMEDKVGGGIQLATGVLAYILTIAGIANIVKGSESTYEKTGGGYTTDPNYPYNPPTYEPETYEWVNDQQALDSGTAMTVIGGILLTGNAVFNIVRSATYNKPAPALAGGFDPSGMQIALLPGNKVGLSYTMRF